MATSTFIGISTGKRLLSSAFNSSNLPEKFLVLHEQRFAHNSSTVSKSIIVAKKSTSFGSNLPSNRHTHSINAIKEHASTYSHPSIEEAWFQEVGMDDIDAENSLEAIILLQKAMLEKQWNLSFDETTIVPVPRESESAEVVTRSGLTARRRRTSNRKKSMNQNVSNDLSNSKRIRSSSDSPELQGKLRGYIRGRVSEELLTHAEVVYLSRKIKTGLYFEEQRKKLKKKLGFDPSDTKLATSLGMSRTELHAKMMECSLARAKLTMSNVRLVMSIAQKYDNSGADMSDLIQGGLIGLLRGIEKFDSSKGCRISTYVYWWIRQVNAT